MRTMNCELCGADEILHDTEIPMNKREAFHALVCDDCVDDIPNIEEFGTPQEYDKDPTEWWHREGRERYEEHGSKNQWERKADRLHSETPLPDDGGSDSVDW